MFSGCPARTHAGIATQNVVERQLKEEKIHPASALPRKVHRTLWNVREKSADDYSPIEKVVARPVRTAERTVYEWMRVYTRRLKKFLSRFRTKGLIYPAAII